MAYYKIPKGSKVYDDLVNLSTKIDYVNEEINKILDEFSAVRYCGLQNSPWGGISAIQFSENPPLNWKAVDKDQKLYYPKAKLKSTCARIEGLPRIEWSELNDLVGFKAPQTVTLNARIQWIVGVGIIFGNKFHLMNIVIGAEYVPINDVIEIIESEFLRDSKVLEESLKSKNQEL